MLLASTRERNTRTFLDFDVLARPCFGVQHLWQDLGRDNRVECRGGCRSGSAELSTSRAHLRWKLHLFLGATRRAAGAVNDLRRTSVRRVRRPTTFFLLLRPVPSHGAEPWSLTPSKISISNGDVLMKISARNQLFRDRDAWGGSRSVAVNDEIELDVAQSCASSPRSRAKAVPSSVACSRVSNAFSRWSGVVDHHIPTSAGIKLSRATYLACNPCLASFRGAVNTSRAPSVGRRRGRRGHSPNEIAKALGHRQVQSRRDAVFKATS